MKKSYRISQEYSGMAVRDYARSVLGYSARTFKDAKYRGSITVDGQAVYANYVLSGGQTLCIETPEKPCSRVTAQPIPLDILYEDEDFLFVNKPSGMPAHPSFNHRDKTLANAVAYYYRREPFTFRLLTRLDADTTGVAAIARNAFAAGTFLSCRPQKEYLAVCVGTPDPPEGVIDAPIAHASDSIIRQEIRPDGRPSVTEYRLLRQKDGLSLVQALPRTGRTHQIRLHLASIGCPLYGDFLYGTEVKGERTRLHCETLSFIHPASGKILRVTAPLPQDFQSLI